MSTSGIYKIQSVIKPERIYIGSAVKINKRWNEHLCRLRKGKHPNNKLQNHYNKYGIEDLVFIIIEPCFPQFLTNREQFYIDTLNPSFNLRKYASSNIGVKMSDEVKLKIKLALIGKNKGKKRSDEAKIKMRLSAVGRNKGKKNHLGYKNTEETKRKMSDIARGKPKSEKHKQNMRHSHKKIT